MAEHLLNQRSVKHSIRSVKGSIFVWGSEQVLFE